MESDGRRTQVWRVPGPVVGAQLARSLERLPEGYRRARGFHLGIHPNEPDLDFARQLRALGGMVGFETFKPADRQPDSTSLRALLSTADTFSLNLLEARSLLGLGEPAELIVRLIEDGASVVALRLGEAGSIVHDQRAGRGARLPALPTTVVDPVGAGNAYCGAFLAGWAQTGDVITAGQYGAVAASFLVEQVGVPLASHQIRAAAKERLAALKPLTEPFSIR
jgi:sugar/nucleoside kinase (ribokinase family)